MKDKSTRKLMISGKYSYIVSIPREIISELGWRKKQKLVVVKEGDKIVISDWKK